MIWSAEKTGGAPFGSIAFGAGVFVAAGTDRCAVSTDGESWTDCGVSSSTLAQVVFVNGEFILGDDAGFFRSADGTSFTHVDAAGPDVEEHGAGVYVGSSWQGRLSSSPESDHLDRAGGQHGSVVRAGRLRSGHAMMRGRHPLLVPLFAAKRADRSRLQRRSVYLCGLDLHQRVHHVHHRIGVRGRRRRLVGEHRSRSGDRRGRRGRERAGGDGARHPLAFGYGGIRVVSRDAGLTWGDRAFVIPDGVDDEHLLRAAVYGDGLWIATGWAYWTSPDGVAWTDHGLINDGILPCNIVEGLAYHGGYYWAACPQYIAGEPDALGAVFRSTDGLVWSDVIGVIGDTQGHLSLTARGGKMVAYGDDEVSFESTDGVTWSSCPVSWRPPTARAPSRASPTATPPRSATWHGSTALAERRVEGQDRALHRQRDLRDGLRRRPAQQPVPGPLLRRGLRRSY